MVLSADQKKMVANADYYYVFIIGSADVFYPIFSGSSIHLYFILSVNPITVEIDCFVAAKQPFIIKPGR
jgi:hypothetical protein